MYDYLIVGAGLFGSICAYELAKKNKKVIVIDKRNHIGGNVYTENVDGINVHKYGAHIFHTSDDQVWNYINQFAEFNNYINSPVAIYKNEIYNLPFNMNTFSRMWGITKPFEAKLIIDKQKSDFNFVSPKNLEEQALMLVGRDIYDKLIKGYTEKQWGKKASELPKEIIKRLPLRFTYDNNYFNDRYQGIPIGGYTKIFEQLLEKCQLKLGCDYIDDCEKYNSMAKKIIYTGTIDRYYNYKFGKLEYRSLRFSQERLNTDNFQGNAVVNYTDYETPYTRIIEHKHFDFSEQNHTIITYEYPDVWDETKEPYYPINNDANNALYDKYLASASKEKNIAFCGRLGQYKYLDMDKVIKQALIFLQSQFVKS